MSNTYTIQCTDCAKTYDVGQTSNGVPYVYNDFEFLQFLIEHRGHTLLFTDEWGDVTPHIDLQKQLDVTLELICSAFNFKKDYFILGKEVYAPQLPKDTCNSFKVTFVRKATFIDEAIEKVVSALQEYVQETK